MVILIGVHDLEYPIREERIGFEPEEAHASAELLLGHLLLLVDAQVLRRLLHADRQLLVLAQQALLYR